jgi:hypothetical protein
MGLDRPANSVHQQIALEARSPDQIVEIFIAGLVSPEDLEPTHALIDQQRKIRVHHLGMLACCGSGQSNEYVSAACKKPRVSVPGAMWYMHETCVTNPRVCDI